MAPKRHLNLSKARQNVSQAPQVRDRSPKGRDAEGGSVAKRRDISARSRAKRGARGPARDALHVSPARAHARVRRRDPETDARPPRRKSDLQRSAIDLSWRFTL